MKTKTPIVAAVMLAPIAANAISGADLFVDLDKYVGKEVVLENVEVYAASNDGAGAKSSGVTFSLKWQGADRETLRKLLKDCNSLSGCNLQRLLVTPSGQSTGRGPILINVKIPAERD
jgi:hypothetical protein